MSLYHNKRSFIRNYKLINYCIIKILKICTNHNIKRHCKDKKAGINLYLSQLNRIDKNKNNR